jgi:hypothetical protein
MHCRCLHVIWPNHRHRRMRDKENTVNHKFMFSRLSGSVHDSNGCTWKLRNK